MTIVSSLKALFRKMTGKDTTGSTIDEIISQLSTEYTPGGGSSLPDMTGNSGKFLTNNGTAASWGDVPSDEYLITAEFDENFVLSNFQHDGEAADDEEVLRAYNAGVSVRMFATGTGDATGTYANMLMSQNGNGTMVFTGVGVTGVTADNPPKLIWRILCAPILTLESNITMTLIDTLPDIVNGDTGKVLGVDSNNKYALLNNTGNDMFITFESTGPNEWAAYYNGSAITISQMITAVQNGMNVRGTMTNNTTGVTTLADVNGYNETSVEIWFGTCMPGSNNDAVAAVLYGVHDAEHGDAWALYSA